jgi:hypothetical protein
LKQSLEKGGQGASAAARGAAKEGINAVRRATAAKAARAETEEHAPAERHYPRKKAG